MNIGTLPKFQSLKGLILTTRVYKLSRVVPKFQSLKGLILTALEMLSGMLNAYFNPLKVLF